MNLKEKILRLIDLKSELIQIENNCDEWTCCGCEVCPHQVRKDDIKKEIESIDLGDK